jgi:hypothetical protein
MCGGIHRGIGAGIGDAQRTRSSVVSIVVCICKDMHVQTVHDPMRSTAGDVSVSSLDGGGDALLGLADRRRGDL